MELKKTINESSVTIPGTFLEILGYGVLLKGGSGTGKSVLSLELIQRGHRLIADDAVWFEKKRSHIRGKCPLSIQDFMYVQELGIINIRKTFGASAICLQTELKLVIQLSTNAKKKTSRLLNPYKTTSILNVKIPMLAMPARFACTTLIETAVQDLSLKAKGYFALNEFHSQHRKFMNSLSNKKL